VSVALSRYPSFIFLALALLCSSLPAHAGPFLATLDDFHPNCDIRQLNLSADQHAALRRLRTDFKQINEILAKYKKGDGFESYDKLSEDDRKKLQAPINTLAEELGKLRGTLGLN